MNPIYFNLLIPLINTGVWDLISKVIPNNALILPGSIFIVILPGFFIALNIYCLRFSRPSIVFILMAFGLVLDDLLGFLVWGLRTGRLLNPDWGTKLAHSVIIAYYLAVSVGFYLIVKIRLMIKQAKNRKTGKS